MTGAVLFLLVVIASGGGFLLLAASQEQHRSACRRMLVPDKAPVTVLRIAGSGLLLLSAILAVVRDGFAFGLTIWTLTITLTAFFIALILMLLKDDQPASEE